MGYLFENRCYSSVSSLHEAVAATCPAVSNGDAIKCIPTSTDITIERTDILTSTVHSLTYTPQQISCDLSATVADVVSLSWQLALILIAGFAVRQMIKVFQT
ncbi:MAG: hypothetical protein KF908_15140 [Nitrosomonas sp.]|nr:hypothetical protein [Nitrosomonas sp.]MCW5608982.1 hypothetical protein [Nitrosomonas sp.]